MLKKIIWAIDGSPTAERVLPVVKGFAESAGAKLVVAHVHEHLGIGRTLILDDDHRSLDAKLQRTVHDLNRDGFDAELALTDSRAGRAAQVIADLAREAGADLIVAGTHGQGPVAGFFLGGFTIHLLKVASCPVLVPREPQDSTRRPAATAPNTTFSKAAIPPQRTVVPAGADAGPMRSAETRRAMPATMLGRGDIRVHQVAAHLVAEFDGAMRSEVVERVVLAARRDLDGEVPPEALPEFLHRLAWQRLVDLQAGTPSDDPSCPTHPRRSGPDE